MRRLEMENKYLNEAIIGNKNMIATLTEKGELQRLYFPNKDNRQYINFYHTGVTVNQCDLIYLHDDINNVYKQYYDTDTNILNTEITNTYFNLKVVQTDFFMMKENVLVKRYIFLNESKIDLDTKFYIHSELLSDQNNFVSCKVIDNGMIQYAHDYTVSTFAKGHKIAKHQINGSKETIKRAEIYDKDYIGMSNDSSICYDLGTIKPQEKKALEICILIDENKNISELENEIDRITKIDINKEYTSAKSFWRKYVKSHNGLNLKEPTNSYEENKNAPRHAAHDINLVCMLIRQRRTTGTHRSARHVCQVAHPDQYGTGRNFRKTCHGLCLRVRRPNRTIRRQPQRRWIGQRPASHRQPCRQHAVHLRRHLDGRHSDLLARRQDACRLLPLLSLCRHHRRCGSHAFPNQCRPKCGNRLQGQRPADRNRRRRAPGRNRRHHHVAPHAEPNGDHPCSRQRLHGRKPRRRRCLGENQWRQDESIGQSRHGHRHGHGGNRNRDPSSHRRRI